MAEHAMWSEKYRPRSLSEMRNQTEIVGRLRMFVETKSMTHCLFAGPPGTGKTTLAYAGAKRLNREVYIMQATVDTRPEDLLVTPVIEGAGRLRYVASPLVTAMAFPVLVFLMYPTVVHFLVLHFHSSSKPPFDLINITVTLPIYNLYP
jgi:ABC-type cobalamin/Fe3+-siderophores transport system ATPase subunit